MATQVPDHGGFHLTEDFALRILDEFKRLQDDAKALQKDVVRCLVEVEHVGAAVKELAARLTKLEDGRVRTSDIEEIGEQLESLRGTGVELNKAQQGLSGRVQTLEEAAVAALNRAAKALENEVTALKVERAKDVERIEKLENWRIYLTGAAFGGGAVVGLIFEGLRRLFK